MQNNIKTVCSHTWFILCALCKEWFRNTALGYEMAVLHCEVFHHMIRGHYSAAGDKVIATDAMRGAVREIVNFCITSEL
jgi:hypothetical protein